MQVSTQPVLVIGSGGRLGAALMQYFQQNNQPAVGWGRTELDLANPEEVAAKTADLPYSAIILSAALTSLDVCETQPALAKQVNALTPGILARQAAHHGIRCLYISTDYVYDGSLPGLKSENAPLAPNSVYASTKLAGEQAVLAASPRHLVARTSWIFGPHRPSFVDGLLNNARLGNPLQAIGGKYSVPSYSLHLAAALAEMLRHPAAEGIYNVVNQGPADVSWHTLGTEALRQAASLGYLPSQPPLQEIPLSEMTSFIAPRPIHTAAAVDKLEQLLNRPMQPWQAALAEYFQQMGPKACG